jgi:hypothetical protein
LIFNFSYARVPEMSKQEARLKAGAMRELARQCPHYVVLLLATAGGPDRAIVGTGRTSLWEFKHGTPGFKSHDLQKLTCLRLAVQGYCRYVVWEERRGIKRTLIVHPNHIGDLLPEAWCVGFDHKWLVEQIRKVHDNVRV